MAIVSHSSAGAGTVLSNATLTKAVPIFVAVMIWLIRVLIIGTFSLAGDRLFSTDQQGLRNAPRPAMQTSQPVLRPASTLNRPGNAPAFRPAPKPMQQTSFGQAEPTYHNVSFSERNNTERYDV